MAKKEQILEILNAYKSEADNFNDAIFTDKFEVLAQDIVKLFAIPDVRLSLPDAENIDYLRGFIDGYGGEEPHEVFPDGFKGINEVYDKVDELNGQRLCFVDA